MLITKYFLVDWLHFFKAIRETILWSRLYICPAFLHPCPISPSLSDSYSLRLLGISVHHHMHAGCAWPRVTFFLLLFPTMILIYGQFCDLLWRSGLGGRCCFGNILFCTHCTNNTGHGNFLVVIVARKRKGKYYRQLQ